MKKPLSILFAALAALLCTACGSSGRVCSPDGTLCLEVAERGGRIGYSVTRRGAPLLDFSTLGFELLDAVWSIYNGFEPIGTLEGSTPSFTFDSPGTYRADAKGRTADGTEHLWRIPVICDGEVAREFAWTYDDTEHTVSVSIDYLHYLDRHGRSQDIRGTVGEGSIVFADPSDPVVAALSSKLESMASGIGLDPVETADFILAFVQSMGSDGTKLWKYPVEVLFETSGNDRSCSALYASLMSSLGYRSSLLLFPGHTAAGVEIEGSKGVFYSYYGIKYRYCECSPSSDESVGEKPEGIANRVSMILEVRFQE